jgi:hypothetical protein
MARGRDVTDTYADGNLEARIEVIKARIESWAVRHEIWRDCGFQSWAERYDDEPPVNPCVLILYCQEPLDDVLSGAADGNLQNEFVDLLEDTGFHFDLESHGVASFWVADDEPLKKAYQDYYEWRWILDLIQPDYCDLYEEICQRFKRRPDDLHRLTSRQFEKLLDAIFRNNGYATKLGPGQADGGVDLHLYSNDAIGEVVTLVQARRYAKSRPIRLEAVQALSASVEDERANRGLFVTTSRFLPSAKKFAARQNRKLALATPNDLVRWSASAAQRIIRDKSKLVSRTHVRSLLKRNVKKGLEGSVFVASTGYTIVDNTFALVLKETKGAALLMKLPQDITSHDGYGQRGYHIPRLDASALSNLNGDKVFRAKKVTRKSGEVDLWGDRNLYHAWDKTPQYFDHYD